jgi:hypothetical protein
MAKTISSRLRRFEEKRLRNRLMLALIGTITIIVLVVIFGFKFFVNFTVFLGQMENKDPYSSPTPIALVIPPYLDPLPIATPSGKLLITGRGQANATVVLYINDTESKSVSIGKDGTFLISSLSLAEGNYAIKAKTKDQTGKQSDFSNEVHTQIKRHPPILEITKPTDNITINNEDNIITIEGKTEENTDIRINERFVVVKPDGSFSYPFPLQNGENNLEIKAIDQAGNTTIVHRKVTYQK